MSLNGDLEAVQKVVGSALASLEANRIRIDDLNVYPVPDGDTGTNLTMTVRALAEAVDNTSAASRESLARDVARGALMGARGQLRRDPLADRARRDRRARRGVRPDDRRAASAALALRGASDAAYRAVRRPVEGTMLSVIRELAEEAEARAPEQPELGELLVDLVRRGEAAVARTPGAAPGAARRRRRRRRRRGPARARARHRRSRQRRGASRGAAGRKSIRASRRSTRSSRATATARCSSSKETISTARRSRSSSRRSATRCSSSATGTRSRCTCTPTIPAPRSRSAARSARSTAVEIANMHEQTQQREERLARGRPRRADGARDHRASSPSSRATATGASSRASRRTSARSPSSKAGRR